MTDSLSSRLQQVRLRLDAACAAAGREPGAATLLAVSKTFPADDLRAAYDCGQRAFGENYVQELQQKCEALAGLDIEWHFIGPLQSNKTRVVAERAHWAHSIDRLKIAERLSAQRPDVLPPLNVCVQVNVSGEDSKSGCAPEEAAALARAAAALPGLRLRGLMCIPEPTQDAARLAAQFARLRGLLQQLNAEGLALDTLSMGMSADLEAAVAEGATLVRVGSAIFGQRDYQH
ncbi:YggS family pyridoxal phosphate-dependent enzyme [Chromobacterium vaccinii]|uniref:YggS family pyridoxal phosphate-dependent enzyme n=1 Tax=Chromobacterium vaccinii TaxID=1108595 RepID=UPI000617C05E|nr:YggS family pyridoxal phosphate-dependent enzyme [Chromobacterium vaccinii]QND82436.1 Pyridoxal phosphate-containing protein YggS [Chromobacterium vaccinii]QND87666.1 Pyridoxal phosphate-containing protein YggS [Chromobacterium vaccinii]